MRQLNDTTDIIDIELAHMEHDKYIAEQLLILLREHKENCHAPDCGISLGSFKPLYESLVGREIKASELYCFT